MARVLTEAESRARVAELRRMGCKVERRKLPDGTGVVLRKCPPGVRPPRPNPEDCPECYAENQLGGAGTALLIGGAALLGFFLFSRRADARRATASTCAIDVQKLDRWGNARGFPVFHIPGSTNLPTPESLFADVFPNLQSGTQVVVVLQDGSFWYYINEPPSSGRADNLRADYCAFEG